ncbi:hypothetical protein SmJEL517_g02008 [Synchytrium microbalum]|uniref:CDP-diacylglycerol--glycerol-3-phosphate 3-phosphatidyltransferase n=1 Tax=Synchytrium microbalum TaxID=1806994 RepID=A0A507C8U4_9FUNG|nr:uncharacterized protein SmJEL517_g02008 [Synchytrium microbalum]TPX35758.1 hypothetical protein SmJEL517_g02008 [Synchytrium microbalum]
MLHQCSLSPTRSVLARVNPVNLIGQNQPLRVLDSISRSKSHTVTSKSRISQSWFLSHASNIRHPMHLSCTRTLSSQPTKPLTPSKAREAARKLIRQATKIPAILTSLRIVREDIYTIPNLLTLGRLVLSPYIGYLIVTESYSSALAFLALASVSDWVDGWYARTFNAKTVLGSALDPAADKVLMTILTVSLSTAGLLPGPLAVLIVGRDVGLVIGTAYYRYATLPPPKTAARYFDVALPSAEVRPPFISKLNTFLQLVLMGTSLMSPLYGFEQHVLMEGLRWTVALTTTWSTFVYMFDRSTIVKIMNKSK